MEILLSVGLGIGLAAACGFRVFFARPGHGRRGQGRCPRPGRGLRVDGRHSRAPRAGRGHRLRDRRLLHTLARQRARRGRDAGCGDGRRCRGRGEHRDRDATGWLGSRSGGRWNGGGSGPDRDDAAAGSLHDGDGRDRQSRRVDRRGRVSRRPVAPGDHDARACSGPRWRSWLLWSVSDSCGGGCSGRGAPSPDAARAFRGRAAEGHGRPSVPRES